MTWQDIRRSKRARGIAIVASLVAVGAAGLAAMPTARAGTGAPIRGVGGMCVDVTWAQTANGTPVQIADCNGNDAQNWAVDGDQGQIRALGKCLDVAGASHADGTPVQLFDCNGTDAQRWWSTNGWLINAGSGKCLDAHGGSAAGTRLQIRGCAGTPHQAWTLPEGPPPGPVDPPAVPAPAGKKGVSAWAFPRLDDSMRDVGAGWYYDWSTSNHDVPAAADFVPMVWGADFVTDAELAAARRSGTTLLGFNEPDMLKQANMSVDQALDLWPRLQETGMRLGSPAVAGNAHHPDKWLNQFMTGARERGLRVDFITLHWYGQDFSEAAVTHFMDYVRAVHEHYGLPIWVTEFGLIDFRVEPPRYPTAEEVTRFIRDATDALEQTSYVERYAWFALPAAGDTEPYGLYREDSTPTAAGAAYRDAGRR
ncbi:glycoside hydrolase family protein [Jidongwangia harbinensis]|uniref:glycoside hydrolase family protein n=1 Tax=Jidongwangia harbinensis TaxID=2878561 RepID=UPI001CDA4DB6|nr:glycoside hydrolase family protein [Jidongwangia harbinensis]MCA2211852.1 ricin-type beta-trefoil lectin domain protein [Jidongwangia harbinensis]